MQFKYSIDWLKSTVDRGKKVKFLHFWGHTHSSDQEVTSACFSQWFPSAFTVDGITYKTAEHWMMAGKARLFDDVAILEQILEADSPGHAKKLGRMVKHFDHDTWEAESYKLVVIGNIHKFNQNTEMGAYLIGTHKRVLVEASPVDAIWGIGMAKDHDQANNVFRWRGRNLLGFALMEARDYLAENGFGEGEDFKLEV